MRKYILIEQSAVEHIVNDNYLQSIEYEKCKMLVNVLRGNEAGTQISGLEIIETDLGLIICGKDVQKTFILFDLEQCKILEKCNDSELVIVLQKTLRFSVRFWNRQSFTNCEKIFKDKTVVFPFPFSVNSAYRIVIQRNPNEKRLIPRGIRNSLFAYKYGEEGNSANCDENPDLYYYRKAGESYLAYWQEIRRRFEDEKTVCNKDDNTVIHLVEADHIKASAEFKYMNYEKQITKLTDAQKRVVMSDDYYSPIRIEGPAGTGKTAALVLRAIRFLSNAEESDKEASVLFVTHSKSTENAVKRLILNLTKEEWLKSENKQNICVITLQEYCINFIQLKETQIIDLDAMEAKQYQLLLIQDAYVRVMGNVYNTFKPLLSDRTVNFFQQEEENRIVQMLQYEFSIRIKGIAEGDIEKYKQLNQTENGIPVECEYDKEFVFRIYSEYQNSLVDQAVYDTDDIILEALARLNGPLWRRMRSIQGKDYLLVDEMHLFNLNEQHVFHFLTKDIDQTNIPICFALDYAQAIGERSDLESNYIEEIISAGKSMSEEFATVFRSSPQIAELCASITASGALLFNGFINPYKYCESTFTAREEELCSIPKLIMYENDYLMQSSLEEHIKNAINKFKCKPAEIAIVFFDAEMLYKYYTQIIGRYEVNYLDGRNADFDQNERKIVCTIPDNINGLEFKSVILVGVDEGRVPQTGISDISSNFLKYSALNKLYISCSRAQYEVLMLGTNVRGVSSCLNHAISKKTILIEGNSGNL